MPRTAPAAPSVRYVAAWMPVDMPPAASTGGAVPSWGSAARISETSKKVLGVVAPPWPPASVPVWNGKEGGQGEDIVLSGLGGAHLGLR